MSETEAGYGFELDSFIRNFFCGSPSPTGGFAHKVDEAGFLIDPLPPSAGVILPLVKGRAAEGGKGSIGRLFVQSPHRERVVLTAPSRLESFQSELVGSIGVLSASRKSC